MLIFHNYINISLKWGWDKINTNRILQHLKEQFPNHRVFSDYGDTMDMYTSEDNREDIIHIFKLDDNSIFRLLKGNSKSINDCIAEFSVPITSRVCDKLHLFLRPYTNTYKAGSDMQLVNIEEIMGMDQIYYDCIKIIRYDDTRTKLNCIFIFNDKDKLQHFKDKNCEYFY